ncbi:PAS domain-containing protein [Streptomyces sp. NPDC101227]|uniref:PAS domain-containing protein n=1 Tax=Streptomyces sp. NPDC101227 TaxID=3366136 RepID=UPI003813F12C
MVLTVLRTTDVLPMQAGSLIVLVIGVAIAASLALSRMRLSDTIITVFEAGLKAATVLQANASAPSVAVVEVDYNGKIVQCEHAEVIHWTYGALHGRPLEDLIPDRYLRGHREGFERFREAGDTHVAGATLHVPVLGQDGQEHSMRLSVARIGEAFVGTLSPNSEVTNYDPDAWVLK